MQSIIERIRAVGIYEQLESTTKPSWQEFEKHFLMSIRIHKLYSQLFFYIQGFQYIKTRDLLVAYSLIYYETVGAVKEAAIQLIHALHKEPIYTELFGKILYQALRNFERTYVPWKIEDRDKTLEILSHMYHSHSKSMQQEECLKIMKKIDNLTFFNLYFLPKE